MHHSFQSSTLNKPPKDKCSDNYSGPKAGSEPEVQTIINLIERIAPVVGAIDFQAYSQFVHFPNGKQSCNNILITVYFCI